MEHKFYSVYQPIIEVRTGRIFGYEALTRGEGRWHSPENLFRQAYDQGYTVDLDFACLHSAVQVLPKLKQKELLFVNVEPFTLSRAFRRDREGGQFLRKISGSGHRIVFELTEGMKGRDFKFIKKGVHFLRRYGCKFAIDDVAGIGFKLFKLLSLRPDFVKIDISLVRGLRESRFQKDLVRRLVALAKKTKARLIAEGLEKKRDVELVYQMGIPYVQGFYFGRPKKSLLKQPK